MFHWPEREEIACEEAELGPENFAERMEMMKYLEAQVYLFHFINWLFKTDE